MTNTLNQLFPFETPVDTTPQEDTHIPLDEVGDYLVIPSDTHGFLDLPAYCNLEQTLEDFVFQDLCTAMARLCIQVNRALLMVHYGLKKKDTKKIALSQFMYIYNVHGIYLGLDEYFIPETHALVSPLPFKNTLVQFAARDNNMAGVECAINLLHATSQMEFQHSISNCQFFHPEQVDTLVSAFDDYMDFAFKSLYAACGNDVCTCIAYPMKCKTFFDCVVEAQGGTPTEAIDCTVAPTPRGGEMYDPSGLIPVIDCYSAIHIPTLFKVDVYDHGEGLREIQWGGLDDLPSVITAPYDFSSDGDEDNDLAFDLTDIDLYL